MDNLACLCYHSRTAQSRNKVFLHQFAVNHIYFLSYFLSIVIQHQNKKPAKTENATKSQKHNVIIQFYISKIKMLYN